MRVLFDSSVLVPALVESHPDHEEALRALQDARDGAVQGFATTHAMAETWGSVTGLRLDPPLRGSEVLASIRELLLGTIEAVPLSEEDYLAALESVSGLGLGSGVIFDALHIQAARRVKADLILTYDLRDFLRVAPDLADRIRRP